MIKKDATIANERLLYLINNYPKEKKSKEPKSKLEFARLLYDNFWKLLGFEEKRNINKRYNYTSPENKDYRNDIDIVYKELCSDLKSENCNTSKANYIMAYCKYFGCSADYLLGFIDLPTHADTDIYKETGLEKDAINTLSILKEFNKDYDQYRKPVELEALNFIMKDSEKFREFIGYISALFIGADKAFYRDKEDKKWHFISDSIHVTYPTSKNANRKQTANTGLLNIKSLAETDCIRHIELLLEDWKQEFKKMEM